MAVSESFSVGLHSVEGIFCVTWKKRMYLDAVYTGQCLISCCTDVDCRALSIDSNCLQAKQFIILHLLCKEGNYTEVNA